MGGSNSGDRPARGGAPEWTHKELRLALDLYFRCGAIGKDHPAVQETVGLLGEFSDQDSYPRSNQAVALKLKQFEHLDKFPERRTSNRIANSTKEIWDLYRGNRARLPMEIGRLRYPVQISGFSEVLVGSPYSPPELTEDLTGLIAEMDEKKSALKSRWEEVLAALEDSGSDAEVLSRLQEKWRVPFTFHSNRLEREGPTSESETERIIDRFRGEENFNLSLAIGILEGLSAEDERVVAGHDMAFRFALSVAQDPEFRITETDIRNLNRLVEVGNVYPDGHLPGAYANRERWIAMDRSRRKTANPEDIPREMERLADWLSNCADDLDHWGPLIATAAHAWLTDIHPFIDGNGRTARLVANMILARGHWPPLVIKSTTDRARYLDELAHSDEGGDVYPLYRFFREVIERKMSDLVATDEIAAVELSFQHKRVLSNTYDNWQGAFSLFKDRLSDHLRPVVEVTFVDTPDYDDFLVSSRRHRAPKIWSLMLWQGDHERLGLIWLGHCSDPMAQMLDRLGTPTYTPSLYVDLVNPDYPGTSRMPRLPATELTNGQFSVEEISLVVSDSPTSGPELDIAVRQVNHRDLGDKNLSRYRRGTELDVLVVPWEEAIRRLSRELEALV